VTAEVDVDLFGGGGGASEGLRRAGIHAVGYENWPVACATRWANGHATIAADLSTIDWTGHAPVRLMWASPPCQPWSAAGDQLGEFDDRDGIPWWLRAVGREGPRHGGSVYG
jgi:DNA (cytosine-5)-methyltransferase 1